MQFVIIIIKKLVFGLTQQNAVGSILCGFKQLKLDFQVIWPEYL